MTVQNIPVIRRITGQAPVTSLQTPAFNIPYVRKEDVVIKIENPEGEIIATLTNGTQFSIEPDTTTGRGGTITFLVPTGDPAPAWLYSVTGGYNLAENYVAIVSRETPLTQETSFNNAGSFTQKSREDVADKLTLITQEHAASLGDLHERVDDTETAGTHAGNAGADAARAETAADDAAKSASDQPAQTLSDGSVVDGAEYSANRAATDKDTTRGYRDQAEDFLRDGDDDLSDADLAALTDTFLLTDASFRTLFYNNDNTPKDLSMDFIIKLMRRLAEITEREANSLGNQVATAVSWAVNRVGDPNEANTDEGGATVLAFDADGNLNLPQTLANFYSARGYAVTSRFLYNRVREIYEDGDDDDDVTANLATWLRDGTLRNQDLSIKKMLEILRPCFPPVTPPTV